MIQSADMIGIWRSETETAVRPQIVAAMIAPGLLTGSIVMGLATISFGFVIGVQGLFARAPVADIQADAPAALPAPEPEPAPLVQTPGVAFLAPSGDEIAVEEILEGVERADPPAAIATPLKVRPMGLTEPRAAGPDNLRSIAGIGPKIATSLNELGIWHFDQIAAWGPAEIAWVDEYFRFPGRILRDKWVEQAKALTA